MTNRPKLSGENAERRGWQRRELLLAFNLYCKIPFGRMHRNNPEIIALATLIERTPSAVAMKLVNFASLDPVHQQRHVSGLKNASRNDRAIFDEFQSNWEKLAYESELSRQDYTSPLPTTTEVIDSEPSQFPIADSVTERTQLVRVRTVQSFFRSAVLASYEYRCAICRIGVQPLLNASHIIPWSEDVTRRADPTNGISLCALHDRAFDRGLLTVDAELRVVISDTLANFTPPSEVHRVALQNIHGCNLNLPHRFHPDRNALEYHRNHIFVAKLCRTNVRKPIKCGYCSKWPI